MSTDIYINLDCGAELQITKIGDRFQVLEIVADSDGWRKQKARVIGRLHNTIIGAVNKVRNFALAQYEVLHSRKWKVRSTQPIKPLKITLISTMNI